MAEHVYAEFFRAIADGTANEWKASPVGTLSLYNTTDHADQIAQHPSEWVLHRKPHTLTIPSFTVPAPMETMPMKGETYYYPIPTLPNDYASTRWAGCDADFMLFQRGLCYTTAADAIARSRAMRGVDPKGGE